MTGTTTLPPDLQAAMRERDEAFYAVDSAQWSKYTASEFTTVQQNGQFMSRTEVWKRIHGAWATVMTQATTATLTEP